MASSSTELPNSNEPEPLEPEEPPAKKRKEVTNPVGAHLLEEYKDWILDPYEDSQCLIPPDTYDPVKPAEPEEPESN